MLGPDSVVAAKAALAAAKLDEAKYYDFHLALMQSKELTREAILATAAASGYDKDQLAAEMEQAWVKTRLDENHALAEKLGINGTPSFVVGKTLIPGAVDLGPARPAGPGRAHRRQLTRRVSAAVPASARRRSAAGPG